MLTTLGIVLLALGMIISIALHEVGHLIPAKRGGVKCTQYMIGFGPTLWSRRRGETEYGIKAIPLGGYVRMIGMYPPKPDGKQRSSRTGFFASLMDEARQTSVEEVGPGQEHRAFYTKPVRRKLLVMFGGPGVNLLLAALLFTVAWAGVGREGPSTAIGAFSKCQIPASETRTQCLDSDSAAPAVQAGLRLKDTIVSINGQQISDWEQVPQIVRGSQGQPLQMVVRGQDNQQRTLTVVPVVQKDTAGQPVPLIGIEPGRQMVRMPIAEVPGTFWDIAKRTTVAVASVPQRMVGVWHAAFSGDKRDPEGPVGVVGVSRLGGEVAAANDLAVIMKISMFINLLASLNLALFVFNMVPLLPLDGGHIAGALYEGIRRRIAAWRHRPDPGYVDVVKLLPVAYTVAALLIGMSALLVYADIVNPLKLRG